MSCWLRIGRGVNTFLYAVGSLGLLVAMAAVVVNVVGRAFLGMPLLGTVEIVGLAGVFLIPFSLCLTERKRAHIDVAMVAIRFSERGQAFFGIVTSLLVLLTVVILAWGGTGLLTEALTRPDMVTPVLRLPKAPFIGVWVAGCILLFAYVFQHLVENLMKAGKK